MGDGSPARNLSWVLTALKHEVKIFRYMEPVPKR
jgi:hypothetical protein